MKSDRLFFSLFAAIFIIALGPLNAQESRASKYGPDSLACVDHLYQYRDFYKQKNFEQAIPHWRYVFLQCPASSQNLYIDGAKIVGYMIGKASGDYAKARLIDTLMMVYDLRIRYFGKEGYVRGRQGLDLKIFDPSDTLKIYHYLRSSVQLEGVNVDPVVLSGCFIINEQLVRNHRWPADSLLVVYGDLTDIIDANLESQADDPVKFNTWVHAKNTVESIFEPYSTCDRLVKLYSGRFAANPMDSSLLMRITRVLEKRDCTDSELFLQAALNLHKIKPTGQSAFMLGNMYMKRDETGKAESYLLEALPMIDESLKSQVYYSLARINLIKKDYQSARSYALKALNLQPGNGNTYILIGDLYVAAAATCGTDEISRNAVYWAAADKYIKARQVDPSVAEAANKRISECSREFPSREKLSMNQLEPGSAYTVGCWINETTTVRAGQ